MRNHANAFSFDPTIISPPRNGQLILSGYGVRISVARRHLVVADGFAGDRRIGTFHRISKLSRIVVLGHSGSISLEALRWIHDIGAAFVHIDADGQLICAESPSSLNDSALRRAQAVAKFNDSGTAIARDLLTAKLSGQLRVSAELPGPRDAADILEDCIDQLQVTDTVDDLRFIEARAAAAYWWQWSEVVLAFAKKDSGRVPEHWKTFGQRHSPLSGQPRRAANPANALLNYLYALLEAEARIASLVVGLDPGMGLLHADQGSRNSFACDLMEAVRPDVDAYLLKLVQARTFAVNDFSEMRSGVCRLAHPLPSMLAETTERWRALLAPVAEQVAKTLLRASGAPERAPRTLKTPLTQRNRRRGRWGRTERTPPAAKVSRACPECGSSVAPDRRYCEQCFPDVKQELVRTFSMSGPKALAEAARAGKGYPSQRDEVRDKQSQTMRRRAREAAAWDAANPDAERDPGVFNNEVLPRLKGIPLSAIMRATGLSRRQAGDIRLGRSTPHPRHWHGLSELTSDGRSTG